MKKCGCRNNEKDGITVVKLLRVDDRLLHGQVAFFWKEYLDLKIILVCNDEAANDDFTKQILEFSKPKGVDLQIVEIAKVKERIRILNEKEENSIVIVGNIFDAEKILNDTNLQVEINIGGLRERPNSVKICDYVALTNEDIRIMKNLIVKNYKFWICRAPRDDRIVINENTPFLG